MSEEQVFISYSHTDADGDWVHAFAEELQRHGVRVWLDEFDVPVGASSSNFIEKGIRSSDMIVHIVTPASIKQPNLFFEIGAAIGTGKRLVAILPQGFEPSLLPQPLRARRFLRQESPEKTAKELLAKTMKEESPQDERG